MNVVKKAISAKGETLAYTMDGTSNSDNDAVLSFLLSVCNPLQIRTKREVSVSDGDAAQRVIITKKVGANCGNTRSVIWATLSMAYRCATCGLMVAVPSGWFES